MLDRLIKGVINSMKIISSEIGNVLKCETLVWHKVSFSIFLVFLIYIIPPMPIKVRM